MFSAKPDTQFNLFRETKLGPKAYAYSVRRNQQWDSFVCLEAPVQPPTGTIILRCGGTDKVLAVPVKKEV